jgi:gamma-glutamyltranspeptidase/glutathione hydrolase
VGKLACAALLLLASAFNLAAQDRSYGRSMVITDRGIVATSHTLASSAGAEVLARGGRARVQRTNLP